MASRAHMHMAFWQELLQLLLPRFLGIGFCLSYTMWGLTGFRASILPWIFMGGVIEFRANAPPGSSLPDNKFP